MNLRVNIKHQKVVFFVLLLLLVSGILLYAVVQARYQDFYLSQKTLSKQAVKGSIYEIQRYIAAQRHLADLYAKVERHEIIKLAENANDERQHEHLFEKLRPYIPEARNYTIADDNGTPLLPDTGKMLGKGCLKDIKSYAHGDKTNKIFVHSNPIPSDYHFDVLTDVSIGNEFHGIFFISINTSVLSKFLGNFQTPGHQLILTRPKKGKTMIELTSKGPRPALKRSINLSDNELDSTLYSEKIPGTYWSLKDIPQANFLSKQYQNFAIQATLVWFVFLTLCLLMLRQIIIEKRQRIRLSDKLQQAHDGLQRTVELRTNALTKSESMFREVLENSKDFLYKFNLTTGSFEYVSPAVNQVIGVEAEKLIQGGIELLFHLIHPDDKERVQHQFNLLLNSNDNSAIQEALVYRINNQTLGCRWLSDNGFVVMNSENTPEYLIGTIRDITKSKQQEQLLSRSKKMDAIGKLTGGIAHDFNNILGIILGSIELIDLNTNNPVKVNKRLETIRKASQRAADLTKKLLGFSRYQPSELKITHIDILIQDMDNLLARALTPQVEVEYQFARDLWPVKINPGDFEDVLINMAINARDAMQGKGHLTIETNNTNLDAKYCLLNPNAKPGDYVELVISDNGQGMSPSQIEHIFEPFYTTKEQGKGTGLGLSTVYGFIKHTGGHIKVYSEPGIGTTFRLYIPKSSESRDIVDEQIDQTSSLFHGTETLLIVDDEKELLKLSSESLQTFGYNILIASNGGAALEVLTKNTDIALLFSDVVMPGGLNGYELAEEAMKIKPELLVLLTSGYSKKAIARNGQARFDANLLSKPYTQLSMAKRIREMLDKASL